MSIQKTISEAIAGEMQALQFIKQLIHDEVKAQLNLNWKCMICGMGMCNEENVQVTRPFVYEEHEEK